MKTVLSVLIPLLLLLAVVTCGHAQDAPDFGIERCMDVIKGGDGGSFSAVCTYDIAYRPRSDVPYYTGRGDDVVAVDKNGNQTSIYTAQGKIVGVAAVQGSLYVVARNNVHDYVFRLFPDSAQSGGWGYAWLWRGCDLWNCDDGDHADQVFSTPDGSWGWRDRQGGWLGCGTVDVWDWSNRAPVIRTLRECAK